MWALILLANHALLCRAQLGNYIGPGWCGGKRVPEGAACDTNVPPVSATDAIARQHDIECGQSSGRVCSAQADQNFIRSAAALPPGAERDLATIMGDVVDKVNTFRRAMHGESQYTWDGGGHPLHSKWTVQPHGSSYDHGHHSHNPHGHNPHGHNPHGHSPSYHGHSPPNSGGTTYNFGGGQMGGFVANDGMMGNFNW